jgi:hypothetical protein
MKHLREYLTEQDETQEQYKLFVDLDGVLVDFDKQAADIGFTQADLNDSKGKARFWHNVGKMARHGFEFWGVMDPMPDMAVLWNYIKGRSPEILSATGHVGNAAEEKHKWVKQHLGVIPVHLVRKSHDKAAFAAPNHILIDDRAKSIDPWVAAGGIGILHTSAANTVQKLKELGL